MDIYIYPMDTPSAEVTKALTQLNRIWSTYREEKHALVVENLEPFLLRRGVSIWSHRSTYRSPRQPFQNVSLTIVFMPPERTFGSDDVKSVCTQLSETTNHLLVVRNKESKVAPGVLDQAGFIWEMVSYEDLRFDKLASNLVPTYSIVAKEQHAKLLGEMGLTLGQEHKLPIMIFRADAIGRLLGFREKDIVKLSHTHILTGVSSSYRFVTCEE